MTLVLHGPSKSHIQVSRFRLFSPNSSCQNRSLGTAFQLSVKTRTPEHHTFFFVFQDLWPQEAICKTRIIDGNKLQMSRKITNSRSKEMKPRITLTSVLRPYRNQNTEQISSFCFIHKTAKKLLSTLTMHFEEKPNHSYVVFQRKLSSDVSEQLSKRCSFLFETLSNYNSIWLIGN